MAKKLTAAEIAAQKQSMEEAEIQRAFEQGITTLRDLISPSSIEIQSDHFRLGTKYGRTIYVYGYPRTLSTGWLSPLINIDEVLDISIYIYPVDTTVVMKNLRKKVTQLEADISLNAERAAFVTQKPTLPSRTPKSFAINYSSVTRNSSASVFTLLFGLIHSTN